MTAKSLLAILERKAEDVCGWGYQPAVALDLDGTLFNNGPRTLKIVEEFLSVPDSRVIRALEVRQMPYQPEETLELVLEACRDRCVPVTWDEHRENFSPFWKDRFFTTAYQRHDLVEDGAPEFAHALLKMGIMVVYLTGRDAENMRHGVVDALFEGGFPLFVSNVQIVLKPTFAAQDEVFKAHVLDDFAASKTRVIALVDNEPRIVNMACGRGVLGVRFMRSCAPHPPVLDSRAHELDSFVVDPKDTPQV